MDNPKVTRLIQEARDRGLVLFVGAGINAGTLPGWEKLLADLTEIAIEWGMPESYDQATRDEIKKLSGNDRWLTPLERATLIKTLLGKQYLPVLRENLYPVSKNPSGEFFNAVAELCELPVVQAVVTYNYDDRLERHFKDNPKRGAYNISGPKQEIQSLNRHKYSAVNAIPLLPIYHVHGFIPESGLLPDPETTMVVLSQDEYFQNSIAPFSWQTTTQLHFLRNYPCLFLGASMTDPNMIRMLNYATSYAQERSVYAVMSRISLLSWAKKFKEHGKTQLKFDDRTKKAICQIKATIFEQLGVTLIVSGKYHKNTTKMVKHIIKELKKKSDKAHLRHQKWTRHPISLVYKSYRGNVVPPCKISR